MTAIRFLSALAILCSIPACYVEHESTIYVPAHPADEWEPEVPQYSIDSDATLGDIHPGVETGLYVEYASGGLWRLYATCGDVSTYGSCHWQVATIVNGGSFGGTEPDDLDADDQLFSDEIGAWLDAYTAGDIDGMFVQTTPGASLEIDAILDDDSAWEYVFWVSEGEAVYGAPTNPIELVPTEP
ncbi:MAG: hypothetical protein JW751_27960 [Polyangiaceae bacterium]|nr:hypothetical protein [Polyangiaceae bacterium]